MSIFAPKPPEHVLQQVNGLLKQEQESLNLVNTTVNPEVFFGRLNFLLDVLLELRQYEKYKIFKGISPTHRYKNILENLGEIVNDFIDRSYAKVLEKIRSLKTEKARQSNLEKYAQSMLSAFEVSNNYFTGHTGTPHYSDRLYTEENLKKVKQIAESITK